MTKETLPVQEEFDELFKKLNGYSVADAVKDCRGWLRMHIRTAFDLGNTTRKKRIVELAGGDWEEITGEDNIPEGYWIKRPKK